MPASTSNLLRLSQSQTEQRKRLSETHYRFSSSRPALRALRCLSANSLANGDSVLVSRVALLPHPLKLAKGGEDASLCSSSRAVAVADGVSGTACDSALYSRALLRAVADGLVDGSASTPLALLAAAHAATRVPGAATAVVALLTDTHTLHVCSLGDSGLLVVRAGELAWASEAQLHSFDCPFQLHADDKSSGDSPSEAACSTVPVQLGDLLITASDGLFDNVPVEEVVRIAATTLQRWPSGGLAQPLQAAAAVAEALSEEAGRRSRDAQCETPYAASCRAELERRAAVADAKAAARPGLLGAFAQALSGSNADEAGALQTRGGKVDDITVIASLVAPAAAPETVAALREAQEADAAARAAQMLPPSVVADYVAEGRVLGEAAGAGKAGKGVAASAFSEREVAAMDKTQLLKALAAANLPTSGKLDTLRQRLLAG